MYHDCLAIMKYFLYTHKKGVQKGGRNTFNKSKSVYT